MPHHRIGQVLLVVALLVVAAGSAAAQTRELDDFHTWTDLATIVDINDRFRYDGDYGVRGLISNDDWTLLYIRPSVRWQAKPWLMLHGGAALFYNFFPGVDLPEVRPWVGLRLLGPRPGGFVFSNYFRGEFRAFYLKSAREWETTLRGRWQLQVTSPRFRISSAREFYGLVSVEPFFKLDSGVLGDFGDRIRYNAGLGKQFGQVRAELNYLLQSGGGALEIEDRAVRLRFFWHIH